MYAESIVQERLADAKELLGYLPEYHSPDEVDKFSEHLKQWERYNAQGQLYFSRDLTKQEYQFIENEKVLCMSDAMYYLTRYAYISDEKDITTRFKFRNTQLIYFSVISQLESQHKPIELIIAKGRQVFVTTITELLISHRIFFHKDVNALTASADRIKSEEMGKKILFAYDNLPWWVRPKYSRRVESVPGLLEFDTLNSRVSIQHGSGQAKAKGQQRVGLGRGGTRTVWHISECASFPNPEEQVEASLMRATHPSPRVFGVIESTFAGKYGWFPDKYKYYKEHRGEPGMRLTPVFFNWPCASEIYPMPGWVDANPIPFEWKPTGKVLEQINKAELFIQTDPLLSNHFGKDWKMPIEQQWFYHCGYTQAEGTGAMSSWIQEMACDDLESMVSSYDSVFGRETIEICHRERDQKYDVYMITGQSVESSHEPPTDEIDYDKPRIPIRHKSNRGDVYQWELIPLKYELYTEATGEQNELDLIDCRLFVYRQPTFRTPGLESNARVKFGMGIDTATGQGYDYSVISITQVGDGAIPDVQAAEWRSNKVGHVEIFAFAMPIALYFTPPKPDILQYPMVGIEVLTTVGDVCQREMKRLGYPNGRFFRFGRYDTVQQKQVTNKQGWFTTGWSRPILLGHFIQYLRNRWYKLNSPWTIEECREFEVHHTASKKVRLEHSSEAYDDGIFATAISSFIMHDMDTVADRSKSQYRAPVDKPPIDLNPYAGYSYTKDDRDPRRLKQVTTIDEMMRESETNRWRG